MELLFLILTLTSIIAKIVLLGICLLPLFVKEKFCLRVTIEQDFELDEYLKFDVPLYLNRLLPGTKASDEKFEKVLSEIDIKENDDIRRLNNIQLSKAAEELLEAMKTGSLRMIESTHVPSVKNAWYYSHLGSLDFARQMGFISEERRQELCREFSRTILNLITKL